MRITNFDTVCSHGNVAGRRATLEILEAGLQVADPYNNTRRLLHLDGQMLVVGQSEFEPVGTPKPRQQLYDLSKVGKIFVYGAGKGIQRVAKAIEDVLGDRITGGHVIAKHGDPIILQKIEVSLGGHPLPDEFCVRGCRRILEMCSDLREDDLVFSVASNGISSLLTLPAPGISLEDVRYTTRLMQIELGVPTGDLNPVRNHLDLMKGGRISLHFQPAQVIHILAHEPRDYQRLMFTNNWLHTLPDCTTFKDAVAILRKWDAWDLVPESIRHHLGKADPAYETVKADVFCKLNSPIYGVMPNRGGMVEAAGIRARELGYTPHKLASFIQAEAKEVARVFANIAKTIEAEGAPFNRPCVLLNTGELVVTVGKESGIGGRNQEYVLEASLAISGSRNIMMAAVDTDGTDGPGGRSSDPVDEAECLAGGIVDGTTADQAQELGIDLVSALRQHNTSEALWQMGSGITVTRNISLADLVVTLIMKE